MAFFNDIKVGIVDFFDGISLKMNNQPSLMASLPIELIVRLFSMVNNPKDIGSFERTCKGFWQIATNPLNSVHTPHRLTCRELSLKMGGELETLAMANIKRDPMASELLNVKDDPRYSEAYFPNYNRALEEVAHIMPLRIDFANLSDDQAKMYELAGRALIEGITRGKLKLKGQFAILNSGRNLLIKVSTAKNSFSVIIYNNLKKSYARQSEEKITPQSFVAKVGQLCLFTTEPENEVADSLMTELTKVHGADFRDKLSEELQALKAKEASSAASSSDSDSNGIGE